tara:strand:+ start:1036 stop:2376 length:1341 start_codon:yes stop_codon:yes gene_type:complete
MSGTSRYIEIRPDNIPADGKISFKNGFPVLSFTISAQAGLLDPSTIRVVGDFSAYKNNLGTPTPIRAGDDLTMNNRLGIYNIIESFTVRSTRSKMICESIRHFSKFMNSYLALNSSLADQMSHLGTSCLCMPNSRSFRKSVMETPAGTDTPQTNSFSFHTPSGFLMSGNMIDLRPDAFGGIQLEYLLQPDSNVFYQENGSSAGVSDAHYELSNLKLTCEVQDIDDSSITGDSSEGMMEFNSITSLYTSINSTNAQLQYSLALKNVISAFATFVPVRSINTLTQDGQVTVYPSGVGTDDSKLAFIKRVQFLKGGSKYPADFDYVNNIVNDSRSQLPDPQLVGNLIDALSPDYTSDRFSISPSNMNRDYNMTISSSTDTSYNLIPEGGSVMSLAVKYGIGGVGEDFSQEQFGLSIESQLDKDRPIGVYIFIKSRQQLLFSPSGVQLRQ